MPARDFVRVDDFLLDNDVGNLVRTGGFFRPDEVALWLEGCISSAIEDMLQLLRHKPTIFLYSGLDPNDRGVAGIAGNELL
jgi:hypothetical protein